MDEIEYAPGLVDVARRSLSSRPKLSDADMGRAIETLISAGLSQCKLGADAVSWTPPEALRGLDLLILRSLDRRGRRGAQGPLVVQALNRDADDTARAFMVGFERSRDGGLRAYHVTALVAALKSGDDWLHPHCCTWENQAAETYRWAFRRRGREYELYVTQQRNKRWSASLRGVYARDECFDSTTGTPLIPDSSGFDAGPQYRGIGAKRIVLLAPVHVTLVQRLEFETPQDAFDEMAPLLPLSALLARTGLQPDSRVLL